MNRRDLLQRMGATSVSALAAPVFAQPKAPLRIGYCLSLSGALGGNGQSARLAHEIWREDVNAAGGLLGRPVELICYDDATDGSKVEAIYKRLLEEDRVDLIIGGYGTNSLKPAMPLAIARRKYLVGLMGLGVNTEFAYPGYFAMIPTGPDPSAALTEGFFSVAAAQSPRPTTVTLLTADAEFARNPVIGARANAAKYGFKIVSELTYSLNTTDFAALIDKAAQTDCDALFLCSYLNDSIGLVKALRSHSFRPKIVGAGMIGPQNTSIRTALGPLLNGIVNYEYWAPVPSMTTPSVQKMLNTYYGRASAAGVDPLGHYMAPPAYAQMQVVAQAIQATGGLDDSALISYTKSAKFKTVLGDVSFGPGGEWSEPRVLQCQFRGIVGNSADQFRDGSRQVVVTPERMASGTLIYPYARAL